MPDMAADTRFLHRVDLNLLKVFKAVHELGQTTAAAEHLGLTQPAVSQGLRRLREFLDDPLFVPTSAGMQPTARANELAGPVSEALAVIQRALERNPDFQPPTARRRFRLGMLDYGVMALAPALAGVISRRAPGVSVDISHVPSDSAPRMLLADQIDLATGPFARTPATLECTPLFSDDYVVIARAGHPALSVGLNAARLSELPHVDVTYDTSEGGGIDAALHAAGIRRRKAMQVPLFAGACFVVGASDFLAIMPRRLAQAHAGICNLAVHDMPVPFPRLEISALVHRRNSGDAGLKWLRDVLAETAAHAGPLAPSAQGYMFGEDADAGGGKPKVSRKRRKPAATGGPPAVSG